MTNAELIKALRYCRVHPFRPCNGCVLFETDGCINVLHGAAADAIERLVGERDKMRDRLILNICSHCDSHIAGCEGCPIIKDINEVFDE